MRSVVARVTDPPTLIEWLRRKRKIIAWQWASKYGKWMENDEGWHWMYILCGMLLKINDNSNNRLIIIEHRSGRAYTKFNIMMTNLRCELWYMEFIGGVRTQDALSSIYPQYVYAQICRWWCLSDIHEYYFFICIENIKSVELQIFKTQLKIKSQHLILLNVSRAILKFTPKPVRDFFGKHLHVQQVDNLSTSNPTHLSKMPKQHDYL